MINQISTMQRSVDCLTDKFFHDFRHSTFYHAHTKVSPCFHCQSIKCHRFVADIELVSFHYFPKTAIVRQYIDETLLMMMLMKSIEKKGIELR